MTVLLSDDRTTFTAERSTRYALGPPQAPLLTFNAADGNGCAWWADVPDGWDAPQVTTPMDRRQTGHGGYLGESTLEPRPLTFTGTVTAPSAEALEGARARLLRVILSNLSGYLRYTHLDENPPRGLWLRPTGKPSWRYLDERVADFGFVLIAEDPIKTGAAATYGPVRLESGAGEGGYPLGADGAVMPWTAAGGDTRSTVASVANPGDEDAHAVYRITGPVPNPVVQLSTGEFAYLRLTLGALDEARISTAEGTVTVNGVNRYDAWGPGSTFPLIPGRRLNEDGTETTGGADVRLLSLTGGADPAAGLIIDTAPSWK